MESKHKHLEMIQGVINRMASNSFHFKGWSITIIAAISAFAAKDASPALMIIPFVSSLLFWGVDAYYLMLEREFRKLYDITAEKDVRDIDFKMKINRLSFSKWFRTLWRPILLLFYGVVLIMLTALSLILNGYAVEVHVTNAS